MAWAWPVALVILGVEILVGLKMILEYKSDRRDKDGDK